MAITLIAHTIAQSSGGGAVTTSPGIDTSGANFVVVVVSGANAINPIGSVTDNMGNGAYTARTQSPTFGNVGVVEQTFYKASASVGVGHTWTVGAASTFCTIAVAAFSGVATSPFDTEAIGNSGGVSNALQAGSVTPSANGALVVMGTVLRGLNAVNAINSSFTLLDSLDTSSGNAQGGALAYLIQGTAGAVNPTENFAGAGGGNDAAAANTVFLASTGGGSTPQPYFSLTIGGQQSI
jgi:hypothetical protein